MKRIATAIAALTLLAGCGFSVDSKPTETIEPTQSALAKPCPQPPCKKPQPTTTTTSTTTFPPLTTTTTLAPTTTTQPPSTTIATTTVPVTSTTVAPTTTVQDTTTTSVPETTTTSTSTTTTSTSTTTSTTTTTTTTTVPPTTTTTTIPAGSGAQITTDVPAGWRVTINEDFDVPVADKAAFDATYPQRGIKRYPDNYPDTRTKQGKADGGYYNAPISVSGGILKINMDVVNGKARVAAIVPVAVAGNGLWGDAPGMIVEERSRFTYDPGFKSAHLTWPQSNDSTPDGEIDFVEFEARNTVDTFIHHQGATVGNDQKWFTLGVNPYEWHTYRLVWIMGQNIKVYVDGVLKVDYSTRIPSTPMHAVLQNETWLSSSPVPSTSKGLVETDWIRVMIPG